MALLDAIAAESVAVFSAEFAEEVAWTSGGGSSSTVRGIFDRISEVQDIGEMIQMDGVAAMFNAATVDVPGVKHGDTVVARGTTYKVVGVEPDGTGRTVVVLGI